MRRTYFIFLTVFVLSLFILSSCNLPFTIQVVPQTQTTPTAAASAVSATQTPVVITQTSLPTVASTNTMVVVPTLEPTNTPEPTAVTHSLIPGTPSYLSDQVASDCDTGTRSNGQTTIVISGCDYWSREWLERPADSATGKYDHALDIVWAQAGKTEPWVYLRIKFHDLTTLPQGFKAGFELDTNLDSKGEYLLIVNNPTSTTWTTDGVQVWQDTNGDVGGQVPFAYDQNNGNGYETKLFDSGVGKDPDLAWARLSPNNPNTIDFAFKTSLLPNPKEFGWWAWAGTINLDPSKFEIVDHESDSSAWDLDNTCSWIWGTKPTAGELKNLCAVAQPTATPVPTAVSTITSSCPAGPHVCRIGTYWDESTCSCRFFIILLPTNTPIIIK